LQRSPFRQAARTAARKTLAVLPDDVAARAGAVASRVHFLESEEEAIVPAEFATALRADRVVRLRYRDSSGAESVRDVEPLGSIGKEEHWYLIAWCRLREGVRAFRGDRMLSVEVTDERPPQRTLRAEDLALQYGRLRSVVLGFEVTDVDRAFAELAPRSEDVVLPPSTMPWGNRSTLVRDPDGNVVNLFSRPAG
ncbi:WYL domain-containing protein, partial [Rathayibacter sp. AY2B1]